MVVMRSEWKEEERREKVKDRKEKEKGLYCM